MSNWLSRMFTIPHAEQQRLAAVPGINVLGQALQSLAISAALSAVDAHVSDPTLSTVLKSAVATEVQHAIPVPAATADPIAVVDSTLAAAAKLAPVPAAADAANSAASEIAHLTEAVASQQQQINQLITLMTAAVTASLPAQPPAAPHIETAATPPTA